MLQYGLMLRDFWLLILTSLSYSLAASSSFVQEVSHPELTWANLKTIAVMFWQLVLIGILLFDVGWRRYFFFTRGPAIIPIWYQICSV